MAGELLEDLGPHGWGFFCPGCQAGHAFPKEGWEFNGNLDRPTFSPSLVVNENTPAQKCHLLLMDGRLVFLGDSHHDLAGQTVTLEPF